MIHQFLTVLWMQSGPGGDFLAAAMAAHAITTHTELADADAWAQDSAAHGFLPLLSGGSICRHPRESLTSRRSRSEAHTSALQSLMRSSSAVFCLHKTNTTSIQMNQISTT